MKQIETDEQRIAVEIGEEIIANIEIVKTISKLEDGVEKGLDIASGFVRKVCGLDDEE